LKNGNGYVIDYDYYCNLIFEGNYLNGLKHGKCKEYNWKGNLEFDGEYFNGLKVYNKLFHQINF